MQIGEQPEIVEPPAAVPTRVESAADELTTEPAPRRGRAALLPIAAVAVTVFFWASAFVAIRHVAREVSPGALSLGRLLVGSIVLGVVVLIRRRAENRAAAPASGWPSGRAWIRVVAVGVLWFGVYNVALNAAERRIDAGTSAMLVNIGPILVAILAGLTLGERFTRTFAAGAAIAFAGVIVIGIATSTSGASSADGATAGAGSADLWGVVLCLVSAITYAIAVVAQKPLLVTVSGLRVTWLSCLVGTIVCLPFFGQLIDAFRHASAESLWLVAYLGAFPTAVAFTTWAYALARTDAGKLGVTTYLVPPIATLMGWGLLGETPATAAYVGGVLCLAGVAYARRRPAR